MVILDMDMPKCCGECRCLVRLNPEEDCCRINGHVFDDTLDILRDVRDKGCPIVAEICGTKTNVLGFEGEEE